MPCSPRGRAYWALLPASLATAVLTLLVIAPEASAAPHYREYVALGDSWSADVVLLGVASQPTARYAPLGCFQSNRNYPKQVAAAIGVAIFRDATCGSATTDNFAEPQPGLPLGGTNPPQFDRLTRTTDLVTVGIGGNDVGLAAFLVQCINLLPTGTGLPSPLGGSCKQKMTAHGVDQMSKQIEAAEPKLVAAFEGVHKRSPEARLL
ncbi:MAG TPA: hypothetical protein VH008_32880, partial [Pseudonocardia sp.]|nr:hypothetical protein [Pseudonocardia sp.]